MNRLLKRSLIGVAAVLGTTALGVAAYAGVQVRAANASLDKVYDLPLPSIAASSDPAVIARGKHLAEAVAGCVTADCHGTDGAGGRVMSMGPLGTLTGPNITSAGMLAVYSDGELARLLRHGVKKDGRSAVFMPAQDFCWLPDSEISAILSFLRSMPSVTKENGPLDLGTLAKILDRAGLVTIDVARRVQSLPPEIGPAPAPTAEYGRYLTRICTGCHGDHLSGGKIPGAPPSLPTPSNLTPHATGLQGFTFEDWERLLDQGVKKNGQKLDPFMPFEAFRKLDATERRALFEALRALPARPFGER